MRNSNPEIISKEQLKGYRDPTPLEKRAVWYFSKDAILKRCGRLKIVQAVCWAVVALCAAYFIYVMAKGNTEKGTVALDTVAILCFSICAMAVTAERERACLLRHNLYHGIFVVLDVVSDRFETASDSWGRGTVRVCDESGHHCYDKFFVDRQIAAAHKKSYHVPMLLVCEKKHNYYCVIVKDAIHAAVEWDYEPIG